MLAFEGSICDVWGRVGIGDIMGDSNVNADRFLWPHCSVLVPFMAFESEVHVTPLLMLSGVNKTS